MKILFFVFAFIIPGAMYAQLSHPSFKVYDVKKQKLTSLDEVTSNVEKADVLFFGEEHDDSIGHVLEADLLKKLNEKFPGGIALSMEMFHTDVQPIIDEYLAGVISEKNFIKESRAWGNYSDYRPLIEYAKLNKLNVVGANAAARYSNAVTMSGLEVLKSFPPSSKIFLPPLPIDTATGRYYEKFTETLGGHSMGTMKVYQTQNFWDASMAWSIAKFVKTHQGIKILHLNGRFHSDEKLGTVAKLQKYAPKLKIINISSFSDANFENPNWENFGKLADYIILTKAAKE